MPRNVEMGRFSVDLIIANNREIVQLSDGDNALEKVAHVTVRGIVDSGAARLVLPKWVVDDLRLNVDSEVTVRYADNRLAKRQIVDNVWLQLLGRNSVFKAVVEPERQDALIGAIVLEDLDLLVDCLNQTLHPRDPNTILTEIE